MDMRSHVQVVAWLHIALGVLGVLGAGIAFLAIAGGGLLSGELEAIAVTGTVAALVAGFIFLISVPGIIAGVGLLTYRPWARMLTLVVAVFELLNVPLGTALGIYTFWVLLNERTKPLFSPAY